MASKPMTKSNMTVKQQKPKELDWEIRYDEIQREWEKHQTMNTCSVCDSPKGHTSIKDFIREQLFLKGLQDFQICREELTQQRTELLEEISKIEKEYSPYIRNHGLPEHQPLTLTNANREGYNQAIKDITNLLNKKDE